MTCLFMPASPAYALPNAGWREIATEPLIRLAVHRAKSPSAPLRALEVSQQALARLAFRHNSFLVFHAGRITLTGAGLRFSPLVRRSAPRIRAIRSTRFIPAPTCAGLCLAPRQIRAQGTGEAAVLSIGFGHGLGGSAETTPPQDRIACHPVQSHGLHRAPSNGR